MIQKLYYLRFNHYLKLDCYISKKQNIPTERIVMIGDSYVDVKMAKAAGSIGIGVTADPVMQEKMAPFASEIIPTLEKISVRKG